MTPTQVFNTSGSVGASGVTCNSTEQWKPIPAWEGFYEVSNQGRIRSVDRFIRKVTGHSSLYKGKIRAANPDLDGYLCALFSAPGRKKYCMRVHIAVLTAFVGPRPERHECRHLDGNRQNNDLSNLCWGTAYENNLDRIKQATVAYGERHGNCKLSDADVEVIMSSGIQTKDLTRRFGVAKATIIKIRNGTGRRSIADLQRKMEVA